MIIFDRLRDRLLPNSIVARMTAVLFAGIFLSQALGTWLWINQLKKSERSRLIQVSQNMGSRIGQTIDFFVQLPFQYRHMVLDQLRDMGGTRYFVSVNKSFIDLADINETEFSHLVRTNLLSSMQEQNGALKNIHIQFVTFHDLKILTDHNLMVDLPPKWKRFALSDPEDSSPFVVVQLPLKDEWIYLATPVPAGSVLLGINWLNKERTLNLVIVALTVFILTIMLVRWVAKPLRLLAQYAEELGVGRKPRYLQEQGSTEMISTIRAFNGMAQRQQKFIDERERLFASISHDLKTPLTRARLRAEMLDDATTREALIGDLENLDSMVKASLQMLKEDAIHENAVTINLSNLLYELAEKEKIYGFPIQLNIPADLSINGRKMALERLFANLIENAIHYGKHVEIEGEISATNISIKVMDRGPGISDPDKKRVFEPYYRVDSVTPRSGNVGLGLSIVRSIANLHGGELELKDRPGGGLVAEVYFPL